MAEVIRILCVFWCFLLVFGKENYQVTVSYNETVTVSCSATTLIQILNITVNENSKCKPMDCILSEGQINATKSSCDEQHACNITSNIPNSCLLDLGYFNYEYTCKVIAHSCNFDNEWCDWTILPDTDNKFRWKRRQGTTRTGGTGPLSDHTTGSGYYMYTEASKGILGDIAQLKSVGITSSPYQCLSFWYHMRGDDIGLLRVYQIYSMKDEDPPIWTVDGEQGTGWIYQAINLTYKNEYFQIMFEGVKGDDTKGDIALDDITITNSYCEVIPFSCNFDNDWCDLTISPVTNNAFRWKHRHGTTSTGGTGPAGDHFTGSGYYAYTEASKGGQGDITHLETVGIISSPYQCLSFWYHMHGYDIGSLRVYQIYSLQDEDMPIWTVDGEQGNGWIYQAINLTYKNEYFRIMFEGVRGDGFNGDIALDDITITNSYCEDLRSRCQLSYSDQCTMNSNEEPLFEFKEECTEINQPISLSCSNQYLTVDHDEFIFDPKFEFCHDIYMSSKSSLCNNTHDSEICTFNLHRIIQSYPECFSRYSMTIDYTCEEKTRNSRSQLNSEHSKLTGIAVGVSLGCGMVASIATLIIFLARRSNKNKNGNSIHQQNNYIGNQGVAFPQQRQQNVDKIELIGEINVDHQYHDVKCTPPLPVTDDEYTYIDSMDNPANTCTIELGGQVDKTYTKVNPSNPSSKDSSKQNMAMRRQNDRCNIAYGTNDTIHDVRNGDNEYALIDPRDKSKGLVQTPGKLTIGSYVVSDPNETGFNRHLNMTIERDERSNKPAKCANENRLQNGINSQNASSYERTTEGTYDSAGISLHAVNGNAIYNHTVDDVYDASSHTRKAGEREDTYDHFLGLKTDDDYDIMKCT